MIGFTKNRNIEIRVIFVLITITFIFMIFLNNYINKQFKLALYSSIQNLSYENSMNINKTIENEFTILETIAKSVSNKDLENPQILIESFNNVVTLNDFKRIGISMPNGKTYFDNGAIVDFSGKEMLGKVFSGKKIIITNETTKAEGLEYLIFATPVFRDDKIVAAVVGVALIDELSKNIEIDRINKLGESYIVDKNGNVIFCNGSKQLVKNNLNLFREINLELDSIETIQNDFGILKNSFMATKINDNKYSLYYSKLSYDDWWLIDIISYDTIKIYYNKSIYPLIILIVIILTIVISVFLIIYIREIKDNEKLKLISNTDKITGGKNDLFLKNNIEKILSLNNKLAFIILEVTNIKILVNVLGYGRTEFIVREIYKSLVSNLEPDEVLAHSYLGEFKLIIKYTDIENLKNRLENINFSSINENIKFNMGIYLIEEDNVTFENMCSYANIAKISLGNNIKYAIYNEKIHLSEINKIKLEDDIRNSIINKDFKAWFQPKYGIDGKTIIGAEALVRWYKYGSIISPYIFIPMCEVNGLIKDIDELVFEHVCESLAEWMKKNISLVPISVNLSRRYLDNNSFIISLESYINKYNIPKSLICFEITESTLIENEENLKEIVDLLHKKGFKVLLDDFGVGYSSIKAVLNVQFDILKIDKSFIDEIGNSKNEAVIKYTIEMAKNLGMDVIAEGIETEEQYEFLLQNNCEAFQGYYFSKPMDKERFSELLKNK